MTHDPASTRMRARVGMLRPTFAGARRATLLRALTATALAATWCALAPVAGLPGPVAFAAAADKKPQLSADVVKSLKPAQEAIQKGDPASVDQSVELAKQALAASKTDYDKEMSLRILMAAYGTKKDFAGYASTVEQLLALNPASLTPEERTRFYKQLAQISYQNKDYAKVQQYAPQWAEAGGGSEAYELLAASYLVQKDCKNGIGPLEKSIAGKEPTENQLKQLNFCYYQNGDKQKRGAVMETLATKFPKRDYFIDLLSLYQDGNADNRAVLNLYRLGFDNGWLARESEFLEYADMALEAGSPAEAQKVADAGAQKGAITGGERATRIKTQSRQLAAEDKRTIAQLDKEARAGKNGEADVKVGLAYLGMGENQKAAETIQRGLQPDRVGRVKRVDDAWMMLGIAQARLGNKAEAAKAFEQAAKDPRMAKTADLWTKLTAGAPGAQQAAAQTQAGS